MTNHAALAVEQSSRVVELERALQAEHDRSGGPRPHMIARLNAEKHNAMGLAKVHSNLAIADAINDHTATRTVMP